MTDKTAKNDSNSKAQVAVPIYSGLASSSQIHTVYMPDEIHEQHEDYYPLFELLASCKAHDVVVLQLSCCGGNVSVGYRICHALRNSQATVLCKVEGPCYSMGAMIAVSGDGVQINPGASLMFHSYTAEHQGKARELMDSVAQYDEYYWTTFSYFCEPFLTAKEVGALKNDKDVYISGSDKDYSRRVKRHFKEQQR